MPVPLRSRILLADDHELVRERPEAGPGHRTGSRGGRRGQATGTRRCRLAVSEEIDLAVLDVSMPR